MWVSNSGHGPGFYRRRSRLCAIQGTQVWGQTGTELLQSVWLVEGALFYQGRFFCFFFKFWFVLVFSRGHPKVSFKLALVLSGPPSFHRLHSTGSGGGRRGSRASPVLHTDKMVEEGSAQLQASLGLS